MYQRFHVQNFRGFSDLTIENLSHVNLITGFNNVGKTALLEALFLCSSNTPNSILSIRTLRGLEKLYLAFGKWGESSWSSLFHNHQDSINVRLDGELSSDIGIRSVEISTHLDVSELDNLIQSGNPRTGEFYDEIKGVLSTAETSQAVRYTYTEGDLTRSHYMTFNAGELRITPQPASPTFLTLFLSSRGRVSPEDEAGRFGNLDKKGKQHILLEMLRILEPRLQRLSVIYEAGPILHGDIGLGRMLPLAEMGEGIVRLTSIVNAIAVASNGILLVDEIEIGIHYSVMSRVWEAISKAAREFNTQIFATTHSRECVVAAHEGFSQTERYDLGLYRLYRNGKGEIAVADYDQENLEYAVEAGLEVR